VTTSCRSAPACAALLGVRQHHVFDRRLKQGAAWAEPRQGVGMLGSSVVGLVGLGLIGRHLAQQLRAIGAIVLAYDIGVSDEQARLLGIRLTTLDELLRIADVVSLHLPVTDRTRGMLGRREFALLHDGCLLINSARAELYDQDALVSELQTRRMSAVLDVFVHEPLPAGHVLRRLDNVVLTPHIAGDNLAMCRRCGREAIGTQRDVFAGRGLHDRRYAFP
jgi:phosphoglycerate dehydrogenase-like enzyme